MRCYLFHRGHIGAVEVLVAGTDDDVIQQARAVFEKRKNAFEGFEVWDRTRLVCRYLERSPKPASPAPLKDVVINPNSLSLYRLDFLSEKRRALGQYGFLAESKEAALEIAQLTFDACSDRAARFEVWHDFGVLASEQRPAATTLEQVVAHRQAQVVELEERIRDSKWEVASSKRLLARLDAMNANVSDGVRSRS